jgi:protein-tyrosine phosphatase
MKATVYPIRAAEPYKLSIVARPRGGDWLGDEIDALRREGIDVLVSMLTAEESRELGLEQEANECATAEVTFVNIPILDRDVPVQRDDFLNRVDAVVQEVNRGRSVGVHCRASIGRSSLLAVSVLVRLGWDAKEAFAAAETARGCSVPDTPEQREWVIMNIGRVSPEVRGPESA